MSAALYVYGVAATLTSLPDGLAAVDAPGESVRRLDFDGLCALVSPIAASRLDPLRPHLLAHTRVLEAALALGGVLPMRFGVIVDGPERLGSLMQRHRAAILGDLKRIDGCIEIGLKASWNRDSVWRRVSAADPALAGECARLAKLNPNAGYFDRIEAGRRVAATLAALRSEDAAGLDALIAPFAVASKTLPGADDMMFAHRALLVARQREPALYAALRAHAGDDMDMRYVAPVPPYNFVDLALGGDDLGTQAA